MRRPNTTVVQSLVCLLFFIQIYAQAQTDETVQISSTVFNTTLGEINPKTPEVSTDELKSFLSEGKILLLDTRPHLEWAISHIPGALNVAPKPNMSMSLYTSDVAEVDRLTNGNKSQPLILYCNGPFCGKNKRVAEDLLNAGYTEVRRYQLGAPVWRALGGEMVIEPDGIKYVLEKDQTAVFIDTREPEEFNVNTFPYAFNIPRSKVLKGKDVGEIKAAKDDSRLPMQDHNTRIIVFGKDGLQAKEVAEAITNEAFHNVSYFDGDFDSLMKLTKQ